MAEFLLELYSEEIPPQLQISARLQIKEFIENSFEEENIKYKELSVYSSPTRLTLFINNLADKIKTESKEIKGPKVGSSNQVIQGFLRTKNAFEKDLIEKLNDIEEEEKQKRHSNILQKIYKYQIKNKVINHNQFRFMQNLQVNTNMKTQRYN